MAALVRSGRKDRSDTRRDPSSRRYPEWRHRCGYGWLRRPCARGRRHGHGPAAERQQHVNEVGQNRDGGCPCGWHPKGWSSQHRIDTRDGKVLDQGGRDPSSVAQVAGGYSRGKAAAERIALDCDAPESPVVVLSPRFVWARDDTTALPALVDAARSGTFAWISGSNYLTSTTHVANLSVAVDRALTNGLGGEVYFISEGAPVAFRTFVSALLQTQGLNVLEKSVPRGIVRTVAATGDLLADLSEGTIVPPLTLQAYATSAVEISLSISKARRELDYEPVISKEQALEELRTDQHWYSSRRGALSGLPALIQSTLAGQQSPARNTSGTPRFPAVSSYAGTPLVPYEVRGEGKPKSLGVPLAAAAHAPRRRNSCNGVPAGRRGYPVS
ncbi:hypothetical protein M2267_005672 [Ensifer sp. KUDG1]|uniref:hypothetical protein n=1 Tax=Ensifer sp. KUDG1 TaxID=3373919 RepID=UPI003D1A1F68